MGIDEMDNNSKHKSTSNTEIRVVHEPNSVRTVNRAMDVLFCLADGGVPMGPSEISRRTNVDRATVYRLLQTLAVRDLAIPSEDAGRYVLGPGLLRLASASVGNDIRQIVAPYLRQLRDASGETVALSTIIRNRRVHIMQEVSGQPVRWQIEIGASGPLYAGSPGKAILAFLSPEDQDIAFAQPHIEEFAASTEQAKEQAIREIPLIRERGYAIAARELSEDALGIAAPFFNSIGRPAGAIVICGPKSRFDESTACGYAQPLLSAVAEISARLGYAG
jgi:IclR family transcriptional regulator, acetate operon repressor